MKTIKRVLMLVVCVIALATAANGALVYDIDFDHGVMASAPSPYTASASEKLPTGASMTLYNTAAGSSLVNS
ncbi:MAG: hypothetical protein ACYC54_11465, partial [Sedimentisphaerales bacterium]